MRTAGLLSGAIVAQGNDLISLSRQRTKGLWLARHLSRREGVDWAEDVALCAKWLASAQSPQPLSRMQNPMQNSAADFSGPGEFAAAEAASRH